MAVKRFLSTWMASGRDEEVQGTVLEISASTTTLLDVVTALGEYLTSEEDEIRCKGITFLSAVLEKCPHEKLNHQAARVLATFYCGKLDDTETMTPALRGLAALVKFPKTTSSDATDVVRALFQHVKMRALVQSVRFLVFSIMDTVVARHRDALRCMNDEFLRGFLILVEGEKDPRNLLIAFAIIRVLLIEFDITNYIEGFFNATFCYFPITFRPPPDDPYGITADNLKDSLRACLSANSAFGPLAIPVFLEKLLAGSPVIKRDVLQTIVMCLPIYGSELARNSAPQLWKLLKPEVFQPIDQVTEGEALKTMQALVKLIYKDGDQAQEDIKGFAREACTECIQILGEPEKSQAKAAIKILCALMSTTPRILRFTLSQAVPHLVKLFLSLDEIPARPSILSHMFDLIWTAKRAFEDEGGGNETIPSLLPFKDEVLAVVIVGLKAPLTARAALDCVKGMIATRNLLCEKELGFIVQNMNDVLEADAPELIDARLSVWEILSNVSISHPRHIRELTLPLLFGFLPDRPPVRDAAKARSKYWRALSGLSKLCLPAELFEPLAIHLTTKLDLICDSTAQTNESVDVELSAAYAHSILVTLADTLASKVDRSHSDVPRYINRLVPNLLNQLIMSALASDVRSMIATDQRIINAAARILMLIVGSLPTEKQHTFSAALYSVFLTGKVGAVVIGHQKIPEVPPFLPFQAGAPPSQKNLIPLLATSTTPLRREVSLPVDDLNKFLESIVVWSFQDASNNIQREAAWHIVASVVNKRTQDIGIFLSDRLETIWHRDIADVSLIPDRRRHACMAWYWITKALLVQNHDDSSRFADRLIALFGDEQIGWDAAKLFGELGGRDSILTKRNHAVLKVLHAQKFFNRVLPRIMEGARSSLQPLSQNAYLVALTSLMKAVPKATYVHELPSLIPLLLRGLDLPDADIRANVIDTFLSITDASSAELSSVSGHVATFIPVMLKNCKVEQATSTRVRLLALRYLALLPTTLRYDIIHPYKAKVLRELAYVLDDPKRSVRREAVDARTKWQVEKRLARSD